MNASDRITFQPKAGERNVSLIVVDGKLDPDSSATKIGDRPWCVRIRSQDVAQELCSMPLEELRSVFETLEVPIFPHPTRVSHACNSGVLRSCRTGGESG